jgi:hypothetical protein
LLALVLHAIAFLLAGTSIRPIAQAVAAGHAEQELAIERELAAATDSPGPERSEGAGGALHEPGDLHTSNRGDRAAPAKALDRVARALPAGRLLTKDPDEKRKNDPFDDPFVSWFAGVYAGGPTAAGGGSAAGLTDGSGGHGGANPGGRSGRRDLSHGAHLGPGGEWDCDFPPGNTSRARVRMIVTVRPDGSAESVEIVSDPGHGFGAAARECALKQRFLPASDPDGNPVRGATPAFNVLYTH